MRIIAGTLRGRRLAPPAGTSTRPTSDRVREAIFNVLAHSLASGRLEGARVLDLFAGTGALGFEAMSRGARYCLFVEDDAKARALIRHNGEQLGLLGQIKIWRRDATALGSCAPQPGFDVVFADPPYGRAMGEKAAAELVRGGWLNPGAVVVIEEAESSVLPDLTGLELLDVRGYGDTKVHFYRAVQGP
jgi:16S rRNA (guanine966-N2)-methyltransferase